MTASLDVPSLSSKRTFLRVTCVDGNQFEMPAVEHIDVTQFMAGVKANGFLGTPTWFVVYDSIIWAVKITYMGQDVSTEGMVKQ